MALALFRSDGVTNQMKPPRHLGNTITYFFFLALASLACSQSRERHIRWKKKKAKTKTEKILWIGCSLTPVKRLWQQTLVGMAKKAKVARCSIEAARTLAFLCF